MFTDLLGKIKKYALSNPSAHDIPPVTTEVICEAEKSLGFLLPPVLKLFYLRIGNGFSGNSCEILGLRGGCKSDLGNMLDVYQVLKKNQELQGKVWKAGLLPFCAWGCNIFSCVDCSNPKNQIFTFEDSLIYPQKYSLEQFFEWWVKDIDILSKDDLVLDKIEIKNPFTNKVSIIYQKKRPTSGL